MRLSGYIVFGLWVCTLLTACGPEQTEPTSAKDEVQRLKPPELHCGDAYLVDVKGSQNRSLGVFEALNDKKNLWMTFAPSSGFILARASIFAGKTAALPLDAQGNLAPHDFPIDYKDLDSRPPWSISVPLRSLPACFDISANFEVYRGDDGQGEKLVGWAAGREVGKTGTSFNYCVSECDRQTKSCKISEGKASFRTAGQKAWVQPAEENSPAAYLAQNFDRVFPEGLMLGCNHTLRFHSADAIRELLPAHGAPAVLKDDLSDPKALNNQLAGEICALSLAVQFDEADPDFTPSPVPISVLLVANGAFQGWLVRDILQEANAVLGACASTYGPGQIHDVVHEINNNFANPAFPGNFLTCPKN